MTSNTPPMIALAERDREAGRRTLGRFLCGKAAFGASTSDRSSLRLGMVSPFQLPTKEAKYHEY